MECVEDIIVLLFGIIAVGDKTQFSAPIEMSFIFARCMMAKNSCSSAAECISKMTMFVATGATFFTEDTADNASPRAFAF